MKTKQKTEREKFSNRLDKDLLIREINKSFLMWLMILFCSPKNKWEMQIKTKINQLLNY